MQETSMKLDYSPMHRKFLGVLQGIELDPSIFWFVRLIAPVSIKVLLSRSNLHVPFQITYTWVGNSANISLFSLSGPHMRMHFAMVRATNVRRERNVAILRVPGSPSAALVVVQSDRCWGDDSLMPLDFSSTSGV